MCSIDIAKTKCKKILLVRDSEVLKAKINNKNENLTIKKMKLKDRERSGLFCFGQTRWWALKTEGFNKKLK